MPVDTKLEQFTHRSVQKALVSALGSTLLLMPGMRRDAPETAEEWAIYEPLAVAPTRARRHAFDGIVLFQVTCFARFGELRADGSTDAPWALSGIVRAAIEKKDIEVFDYGKGPTLSFLGPLSIGPADQQYIDESTLAVPGQVPSYPSNVHAVALTFSGHLTST